MKTIIKNNLKEDFRNPQLGLAVMVLFVVLILGKAIYPTEENQDLLISELLNLQNGIDKSMFAEGMREYNICYVIDHVFHWSFLYMILPLAGLPAIIRFCEENSSGFAHMVIGRKGTRNYLLANIISGSILAFITMIVVVLIFFLIVGTILPPMGKVAVEQMIEINKLYGWISVYQGESGMF